MNIIQRALFLIILYWRPEMIRFKSTLKFMMVFLAIVGLVVVIGCGNSTEMQSMTDFLKQFSDTVDEYAAADDAKKEELKAKLDTYASKWSDLEMELDGRITPNDLEKLDKEYKVILKKYSSLTGKS